VIQITSADKDNWHYIWGNNKYTSSKFYHFPYKNVQPLAPFIWIWDSKCSNKIKVFICLLLMDKLMFEILQQQQQQPSLLVLSKLG
jgi:hypothetical protein